MARNKENNKTNKVNPYFKEEKKILGPNDYVLL